MCLCTDSTIVSRLCMRVSFVDVSCIYRHTVYAAGPRPSLHPIPRPVKLLHIRSIRMFDSRSLRRKLGNFIPGEVSSPNLLRLARVHAKKDD